MINLSVEVHDENDSYAARMLVSIPNTSFLVCYLGHVPSLASFSDPWFVRATSLSMN